MNKDINILVVEDDNYINSMLARLLQKDKYNVSQAYSGTEAMMYIEANNFQLILLDLMLPGMTGVEVLKNIRKINQMPVIIISAKIDKQDKIDMLKIGADDYITKPFDIDEVLARIEANLRRYMDFNNGDNCDLNLTYKDIILNKETKEVIVNNHELILTAREFTILELFLSHTKKVFSKANLFESVWETEYLGDENTINVHMSNLRSKLHKANPNEQYIETIWGMGYKIS